MTAAAIAQVVVQALIDHGMPHVVAAPGSRNAPLLLALADRAEVQLTMRTDERGAGFWALGQARASGRPVAVVTTSGTAVGNLLPAVMEAHHSSVPIMIISADRPETSLDTGANQTTHQDAIFADFVAGRARISDRAGTAASQRHQVARLFDLMTAEVPGPTHLNVGLSDPLLSDTAPAAAPGPVRRHLRPPAAPVPLESGPRTVVLAGDAPPATGARIRAAAAGHPLLAEPSSNGRSGAALRTARLLLTTDLADQIERVVVWGHPTLSRPQQALLNRPDVEVVQVGGGPAVHPRTTLRCADVELPAPDPAWTSAWQHRDAELSRRLDALLAGDWHGPAVAAVVNGHVTGDLMVGSSNPVRDLDLAPLQQGSGPRVWANRGLAGIDGLVATASGIASITGSATLLIGDVSFAHDLTSLLTGPLETRPNLRIVVANDRGGSIFATLEQGASAYADAFERVFATAVDLDLAALAAAVGGQYQRVTDAAGLAAALERPITGLEIIEAPIDRADRRSLDAAIRALATD